MFPKRLDNSDATHACKPINVKATMLRGGAHFFPGLVLM